MYRPTKQYAIRGKETSTLNTSILKFEKYIKQKYGKKKINLLLEAFLPDSKVYSCIFEFKKAKRKSNEERVGVE